MHGLHVALLVSGGSLLLVAGVAGALIPRGFLVREAIEPSEPAGRGARGS
jgi:hypothetical protein